MGMLKAKAPLAEMARSFPPLFRSTRVAPVASPVTVPPTVPEPGGVVVPLLLPPPQANRRREEPTTATSVEVRIFM